MLTRSTVRPGGVARVPTPDDRDRSTRPPRTPIEVLDHGFLALDGAFATDLAVVNAARVSFNVASDEMTERDEGLIRFLMRERHGTPFEHGYFRFLVKAPIFVVREHHRHRAGHSYNEWSGRYSKLEAEFYVPDYVRTQVGKPGAYSFEPVEPAVRDAAREEIPAVGRAGVRGLRADARAGRREGGRAHRAAARDVHQVLLELQSALAHALLLAAQLRARAVRDPGIRASRREFSREAHAGHARRVRGERANRPLTPAKTFVRIL